MENKRKLQEQFNYLTSIVEDMSEGCHVTISIKPSKGGKGKAKSYVLANRYVALLKSRMAFDAHDAMAQLKRE